ncbi:Chromosome partition protein MukF [Arsenophonus endosymbiont of Bemisia tabaci Q2]|nr:Chromosome partition protein MukF [Arsenophonus endosymbiont of Bemisia tabaci Q2]
MQNYFTDPWALTVANAERLFDVRDEDLVLSNEEVTGELPAELEYEEFNEINEQLIEIMEQALAGYKKDQHPLDIGLILRDYLTKYPQKRHFDVAHIIVDQAVKLGIAEADFSGIHPEWLAINDYRAKVQAHVIDKY